MMDPLDRERVRVAAEDHAGRYYGGPMRLGRDSAARYTAEGHLRGLCDQYTLGEVWRAVAEVIDARPALLTDTDQVRAARKAERAARCDQAADAAYQAWNAGDADRALRELDRGELIDPDHRISRWYSWEDLRKVVRKGR